MEKNVIKRNASVDPAHKKRDLNQREFLPSLTAQRRPAAESGSRLADGGRLTVTLVFSK